MSLVTKLSLKRGKTKSPQELVKSSKELLSTLTDALPTDGRFQTAREELGKNLTEMRQLILGTSPNSPSTPSTTASNVNFSSATSSMTSSTTTTDVVAQQLTQHLIQSQLLVNLIVELRRIDFEGRKDVAQIFINVLNHKTVANNNNNSSSNNNNNSSNSNSNSKSNHREDASTPRMVFPLVDHIFESNRGLLTSLIRSYEHPELAVSCGSMLRECVRREPLARVILQSASFYELFDHIEAAAFDVAADAFKSLKDLLTIHKQLAASFLEINYDDFFLQVSA